MPKLLYRFRSLERLLGKEGERGELEKLEIYFADPQQLNDPLEGYKDIYWSGDRVVWENLVKHYINSLAQNVFFYFFSLNSSEPEVCEVIIDNYISYLSLPVQKLLEKIHSSVFNLKEVVAYIELLSDFREIRLQELEYHLGVLHHVILHSIFSEIESNNMLPFKLSEHLDDITYSLQLCQMAIDTFETRNGREFPQENYESSYGLKLSAKLANNEENHSSGWFFIAVEFPEAFSLSLEKLTRGKWYTACFMEDCTNSSIWGSYGDNHKGICLIYNNTDPNSEAFNLKIELPVGQNEKGLVKNISDLSLYKVDYERAFPRIDFFNHIGSLPIPILQKYWYTDSNGKRSSCGSEIDTPKWRERYWSNIISSNTTKLSDWSYEKEYRAILMPMIIDLSEKDSRKLKYDFNSLNGLIFGIKTPIAAKAKIVKIIIELCKSEGRSDFNFYQARYNPSTNKISHYKVDLDIDSY